MKHDPVDHPFHYTSHPSGVEVIEVVQDMGFCLGNAWKYLARHRLKGRPIQDLEKALWYLQRELRLRRGVDRGDDDHELTIREFITGETDDDVRAIYRLLARADFMISLAGTDELTEAIERLKIFIEKEKADAPGDL